MKYAFMSFSDPAADLDGLLSSARRHGYDGIEPRLDAGHGHGIEVAASADRRREARRKAAEAGVALCCLATSVKVADPETADRTADELLERIDLAADLECPALRIFGGPFPESLGRDGAIESSAAPLRRVASRAGERGVVLCLETHDAWCDPVHVAGVMEKADVAWAAVNWDVMHPERLKLASLDRSFELLQPWLRHVHVHDARLNDGEFQFAPMGEGHVDHRRVIRLLRDAAYAGYISGEWINWEPAEHHLPREVARLREYEAS
jgi:sugar phosphate isomerase/epimerase